VQVLDEELFSPGSFGGRCLPVRDLDVDETAWCDVLGGSREHRDGLFHVLEHLVERDEVERAEILERHEVAAYCQHAYNVPRMRDRPWIGVEGRAAKPVLSQPCEKHAEARADVEHGRPLRKVPARERGHARDACDVVRLLSRKRHHALEGCGELVAVGRVDVATTVQL
jgi:hypothetical protein